MVSPWASIMDVPAGEQRVRGWRKERPEWTLPQFPSRYNKLDYCLKFLRTQGVCLSSDGWPAMTASLEAYSLQTSLAWCLALPAGPLQPVRTGSDANLPGQFPSPRSLCSAPGFCSLFLPHFWIILCLAAALNRL